MQDGLTIQVEEWFKFCWDWNERQNLHIKLTQRNIKLNSIT